MPAARSHYRVIIPVSVQREAARDRAFEPEGTINANVNVNVNVDVVRYTRAGAGSYESESVCLKSRRVDSKEGWDGIRARSIDGERRRRKRQRDLRNGRGVGVELNLKGGAREGRGRGDVHRGRGRGRGQGRKARGGLGSKWRMEFGMSVTRH
ncbi:hypothetical protein BDN70DRAFT_901529 [Pholiota conissans]|uniref:Uncharacterized protein n=1 Tax=Pholiota conissans TaxID=109636 RepID=A0A9P5YJX7_9AGAR|nr:hypothetical protein BDN70DRAFT_901529 [Pholiota conissans]